MLCSQELPSQCTAAQAAGAELADPTLLSGERLAHSMLDCTLGGLLHVLKSGSQALAPKARALDSVPEPVRAPRLALVLLVLRSSQLLDARFQA